MWIVLATVLVSMQVIAPSRAWLNIKDRAERPQYEELESLKTKKV